MEPGKRHFSKKIVIIAAILAAAFIGVATITFLALMLTKEKNQDHTKTQSAETRQRGEESSSVENNSLLVQTQFLFAKLDKPAHKIEIYRRPPGQDASVKVAEITGNTIGGYSRLASNVAFVVGSEIYTSKNAGESFQKIYTAPQGEDITSIRFSKHQAQLAVAVTQAYSQASAGSAFSNKIIRMNIDGGDQKELFTRQQIGVYIKDWSLEAGKVLYQAGCNRCDQIPRQAEIYDIKTKKTMTLPIDDPETIGNLVLNDTATRVTYTLASHDASVQLYDSLARGYYGPPYSFHQYDIAKQKDKIALRIGKRIAHPKSSSEIPIPPAIATAGTKYGRQHYYLYDNTISLLFDDSSVKLLLAPTEKLRDILFVSEAQVLATVQRGDAWDLVSFSPDSGNKQTLFKADSTMIPLGMSDQF